MPKRPADHPRSAQRPADHPRSANRSADHPRSANGPADRPRAASGAPVPGRRTVTIRGQVADRGRPAGRRSARMVEVDRRRPARRVQDRAASRPDRVAMWAVLLCLVLVVAAAASARAAVRQDRPGAAVVHVTVTRP